MMSQPQAIPTRLDFSAISNYRNSGGGGGSGPDSGSGGRNSPIRTWEDRIIDLSAELQHICGSPSTPPYIIPNLGGGGGSNGRNSPSWPSSVAAHPSTSPPQRPSLATPPTPQSPIPFAPLRPSRPGSERRRVRWSTVTPPTQSGLCRSDVGQTPPPMPATAAAAAAAVLGLHSAMHRTISLQGQQAPVGGSMAGSRPRPIMVRHVETPEKLASRLSAICGIGSTGQASQTTQSNGKLSATTRPEEHRRPSLVRSDATGTGGGGLRLKTLIAPYRADDVIVTVTDSRQLNVVAQTSSGGTQQLHSIDLNPHNRPNFPAIVRRLMCHVTSSGWLYVHEKVAASTASAASSLSVEFPEDVMTFLPVINCDEDRLELTLSLGVPEDFRFEDITVRTVDDDVWIVGSGTGSGSSPPLVDGSPVVGGAFDFPLGGSSSKPVQFKVVVPLPEGTDNRSVVAAMTPRCQVVVKAKLCNTSRRYTF